MRPEGCEREQDAPAFVVGVDGGTTKTIALVADGRGHILGAARGGNSNWTGPDVEIPMQVVVDTVEEALDEAGLSGEDVTMGVFGLAGADWPEDYTRRQAYLQRSGIARQVIVRNDAVVGWRASTRKRFGVVIAAGTGSNTCVLTPDGQEWCYGYYVDVGGAWDLAEAAVWAVLREDDGRGEPTALTPRVLEALDCDSPEMVLRRLTAGMLDRRQVASLCPLVFEVAYEGDAVAASLIVEHGEALAEYATAAIRRYDMADLAFDVALAGSVFKGRGPLLIDTITRAIHRVAPRARIVRARFEPAVGGVLLAYDALDVPVTEDMYRSLAETMPGAGFFHTAEPDPTLD
jgi:N-acetylglucosamine kinase-like BadF-type ATPase